VLGLYDADTDPNADDLGERVKLYYFDAAELGL
jgi:hypothetical protein